MRKPKKIIKAAPQPPIVEHFNIYRFKCSSIHKGRVRTVLLSRPLGKVNTNQGLLAWVMGRAVCGYEYQYPFTSGSVKFDETGSNGKWTGNLGGHPFVIQDLSFVRRRTSMKRRVVTKTRKRNVKLTAARAVR